MRILTNFLMLLLFLSGCLNDKYKNVEIDEEALSNEIYTIVDSLGKHLERLEYDEYISHYADSNLTIAKDGVLYLNGQQYYNDWKKRNLERFASIDSFKITDHKIYVLNPNDVVFIDSYSEIIDIIDYGPVKNRGVWTGVFHKSEGSWKIVTEHISHPR